MSLYFAVQAPGVFCGQRAAPWARHRFLPRLPAQMPEQHCCLRRQGSPTSRHPYWFGLARFGRFVRFGFLRRFSLASARAGSTGSPSPSPVAVSPRRTSRRVGAARRVSTTLDWSGARSCSRARTIEFQRRSKDVGKSLDTLRPSCYWAITGILSIKMPGRCGDVCGREIPGHSAVPRLHLEPLRRRYRETTVVEAAHQVGGRREIVRTRSWWNSTYISTGGVAPHGAMHTIPFGHPDVVHSPFETGTHAEPAGKPIARQSRSRRHEAQSL